MELSLILVPIFVFVLVKMALDQASKARADKLRLLEEAMKNPNVDRATLESLTYQLTGRRPHDFSSPGRVQSRVQALILLVGWIGMFVGGAMWLAGANSSIRGSDEARVAGMVILTVAVGVVSYPFALRELENRRAAQ